MSRKPSIDLHRLELPMTPPPSTSPQRRRKESLLYPQGSPYRYHAQRKQDAVVELIRGWSHRVGAVCPYLPTTKTPSPDKPRCKTTTKLPSPFRRPAWDSSTKSDTAASCNVHIILHNHALALAHKETPVPVAPKFLAKLVLHHHKIYGLDYDSSADEKPSVDSIVAATLWTLKVHPLHGVNVVDPCRLRAAHVCSRLLRPFVQVRVAGATPQRCKPSCSVGASPVWSKGWLDVPNLETRPTEFQVCLLNPCGGRDLVVGSATVSVDGRQGCAFYTLGNRKGKPTGQIKLLYVLETTNAASSSAATPPNAEPSPSPLAVEAAVVAPRAKLLIGDELKMKKTNLRHVETSSVAVVKAPVVYSAEETMAVLAKIEARVRSSKTLQLYDATWIDSMDEKILGQGIHACVKACRVDGCLLALKEYRYDDQKTAEAAALPPFPVATAFNHELLMLSMVFHDNIVRLVGVTLRPRLGFITEYMQDGSLYACREKPCLWASVSLHQKISIALQIACALAYLHRQRILHRDVKSHNVLLAGLSSTAASSIPTAKLCDLGSAIVVGDEKPTEEVGTTGYIAPEVVQGHGYVV
ncbi:hypothetical protein Ae201684_005365 [Aphanomyces euteiches]|uniref:Protein kinase domain-containing protein n=1 Tax=Aphanomyces euteiches TaxID=100861 RepID=A0A6G0XEY6_9STRA|nr:hypothetical protein Ae201684_005365 [Aphanomyces euteiches]KAH9157684.1 hypothetical protein AeRB84_000494 [Aphanomyces euteiches]